MRERGRERGREGGGSERESMYTLPQRSKHMFCWTLSHYQAQSNIWKMKDSDTNRVLTYVTELNLYCACVRVYCFRFTKYVAGNELPFLLVR